MAPLLPDRCVTHGAPIHHGGTRPRRYALTLHPDTLRFAADVAFKEEIK